jgi:hypothetical protein
MLVPFDRNLLYVPKLDGRYIPSVLNDTLRFEQIAGGILICVGSDRTGYVLFKKNQAMLLTALLNENGPDMPRTVPFYTLSDQNELDVYVNLIDDTAMIEHLYTFFNMPLFYSAPYELADIERNISFIEAEKITGILGIRQGAVLNTAVFDHGEFLYLSYYHPDTKSYAIDKNRNSLKSYIKSVPKLKPSVIIKKARNEMLSRSDRKEMVILQNDPIVNTVLCYIDIFEIIYKVLGENFSKEKVGETSSYVFKHLRDKYSPLFSSITYSTESGTVNWNDIFDERRYVSMEYRFEHYHLYLDELLKLLFKAASSLMETDTLKLLVSRVKNYLAMIDRKERDSKEMVYRVEKMLNKLI